MPRLRKASAGCVARWSVAAVAFGAGMHFAQSVVYANNLPFRVQRIMYMGDLDAKRLRIPMVASLRASVEKLPSVEPVASFYRCLLRLASPALVEAVGFHYLSSNPTCIQEVERESLDTADASLFG